MNETAENNLALTMDSTRRADFNALLQQGFGVQAHVGCSLEDLLGDQWGIDPEYVRERITTVFLNNRAIDGLATAVVRDDSVLALSGAMPGLVGATMRRGGYLSAMRGAMTYRDDSAEAGDTVAVIRVKLFNLLLPELGPDFLKRGVIIEAGRLADFFRSKDAEFWQGCRLVRHNGAVSEAGAVTGFCEKRGAAAKIRLSVMFEG